MTPQQQALVTKKKIYEAANPNEAYAKHDQIKAAQSNFERGAKMSPFAQGALTAAQGATFNFAG